MIDYGGQKTDLAVKRAEWRLSRVYRQAAREIEEKTKAWQERHDARDRRYRKMVKEGKMSKADYQAWLKGQVFQEKQWKARREQIQQVLLNADKAAVNVIKEGKLGVFTANANYIGYGLEHDSGLNTGFLLYDEQTVARLIKGNPKLLPMLPPEKAINKDKAYTYYNRLINNAITQGIIQGESVQDIAVRIAKTTGEKCYKSALSNARTAYTGAQNAGRIEGMHQAQRLGIKVQKQWLATPDQRTRDAHVEMDGQVQEVDDPFLSELGEIDYPGDPNADPANVYNCRCSLLYVYPEYPSDMKASADDVEDMSLDEWEEKKAEEDVTLSGAGHGWSTREEYEEARANRQDQYDQEIAEADAWYQKAKKDLTEEFGGPFMKQRIAVRSDNTLTDSEKEAKLQEIADKKKLMDERLMEIGDQYSKKYDEAAARYDSVFDPKYEYKKIEEPISDRESLNAVNPHYFDNELCTVNCQRCAVALEMREQGYDVEALPAPERGMGAQAVLNRIFGGADTLEFEGYGHDNTLKVRDQFKEWGDGSRGVISINRTDGGGHVFNAQYKDGKFWIKDGQIGAMWSDEETGSSIDGGALEGISTFRVTVLRTDNVTVKDIPPSWIKNRGEE